MSSIAKYPCASCPYRRDVPSGVWAPEEYVKLPQYDGETFEQATGIFMCHQQNGKLCSGWVGCHDMSESMALRIGLLNGTIDEQDFDDALNYESPVPLFDSGAEAAKHGMAGVEHPDAKAERTMQKIQRRRERRQPKEG